jgi:cell wall-associated NlpC family hydrolase
MTKAPARGGRVHITKGHHQMTIRQKFATYALACTMLCGGVVGVAEGSAGAAPMPTRAEAATVDPVSTTAAAALAADGTAQFALRLADVSAAVADRLGVEQVRLDAAWITADHVHQVALLSALTQVGVPYRRNMSKVGIGFDCSGLTAYAWAQSGFDIAHHSSTQLRNAAARTISTAQAGDLVYFPGHVMMWLGVDTLVVHAPRRGRPVELWQIGARSARRIKFGDPSVA